MKHAASKRLVAGLRVKSRADWVAVSAALSLLAPVASLAASDAPSPTLGSEVGNQVIEDVEVTAEREALRNAIASFVSKVTRVDGENVARWRDPICPSVSGASPEQGEFIRSRIREIAASAGARVNRDPKCRSNLLIALSSEPDELVASLRAGNPRMFRHQGREKPGQAKHPVRTWWSALLNNADGTPPIQYSSSSPQYRLKDSRIASSVAEDISSVVVIVDINATGTATFGQLADYVAMMSLAQLDVEAGLEASSTILRLFANSGSERPPKGLTDWDQAFLSALYGPSGPLLDQRGQIVRSMVRELAP